MTVAKQLQTRSSAADADSRTITRSSFYCSKIAATCHDIYQMQCDLQIKETRNLAGEPGVPAHSGKKKKKTPSCTSGVFKMQSFSLHKEKKKKCQVRKPGARRRTEFRINDHRGAHGDQKKKKKKYSIFLCFLASGDVLIMTKCRALIRVEGHTELDIIVSYVFWGAHLPKSSSRITRSLVIGSRLVVWDV